jgi:lysophospholipase L1-like esterase
MSFFACLIIGDSLAQGISQALHCPSVNKPGVQTKDFSRQWLAQAYDLQLGTVVVSLGSNDALLQDITPDLLRLRQSLQSERVVWVLPVKAHRYDVNVVAARFRDQTIDAAQVPIAADGIHPTKQGYALMARALSSPSL